MSEDHPEAEEMQSISIELNPNIASTRAVYKVLKTLDDVKEFCSDLIYTREDQILVAQEEKSGIQ
eukprot:gnl/Chilomastix_caulleri/3347.p1 GENE.gnl/Chilomastix_caulleri/3347~~gnl/Chilomastix_caulleri/3347.p1  ORF type:complete len:65 (+),score=6.58 gnl/Chilomastix_caulleri/3347:81-275(+)